MSFSPDGHFFVCLGQDEGCNTTEIHLWKESHTSYVLHQRLGSSSHNLRPLISPNNRSIIGIGEKEIQLWHIMDSTISPSTVSAQASKKHDKDFIVGFSPDEVLAAVAQWENEVITILDLKSGTQQLVIDTDMAVYGLGITTSSIVVVGDRKFSNKVVVTWNLPTGDHISNFSVDTTHIAQTIELDYGWSSQTRGIKVALVFPNLQYIALKVIELGGSSWEDSSLCLYNIPARQHLEPVLMTQWDIPWFTPDECEIRNMGPIKIVTRWKIVEGNESGITKTKLEHLGMIVDQPVGPPWQSSCGSQVIDDQWILSSSGKRLLWLPPSWRTYEEFGVCKMWSGRFLALLHHGLPEAVILELK